MSESGPMRFVSGPRLCLGLLVLLLAVTSAAHLAWIHADVGAMPHSDTYSMLSRALRFMNDTEAGTAARPARLWEQVGRMSVAGRPPLYQLISVPSLGLWGMDQDGAQISNLLYWILLGLATFFLGAEVRSLGTGLLAAVMVLTYPPTVHLVAVYRPHAAFPGLCALLLLLVVRVLRTRRLRDVWGMVSVLVVGMWIHPTFAFFAAAPVGVLLVHLALVAHRERPRPDLSLWWRGLVPGLAVALLLVLSWYVTWGQGLVADFFDWKTTTPELAPPGGRVRSGFYDVPGNALWYLRTAPAVLTWFHALLGAVGVFAALAARRLVLLVLALHVVGGYLVQAIVDNGLHWYRIAGILPALAVLSATFILGLRPTTVRGALVVLVVAVGTSTFSYVLRGGARLEPVARMLGGVVDSPTCRQQAARSFALCARPPVSQKPPSDAILERLADLPPCRSRAGCRVMVLPRPGLSAVLLRTAKEARWPDLQISLTSIGSRRRGKPFRFRALMESDVIVYVDGQSRGGNFNAIAEEFLRSVPPVFSRHHQEVWRLQREGHPPVILLARTQPLTNAEVEEAIETLPVEVEGSQVRALRRHL